MAAPAVRYQPPAAELRPFITTYYWVDIPSGIGEQRDWLHPEWPNVRFILDGDWRTAASGGWEAPPPCALFGATCRAIPVAAPSPGRLVGLGLLPLGFATLFDVQAAALTDRVEALDGHLDGAARIHGRLAKDADPQAQACLLDAWFRDHVGRRPVVPDILRRAHAVLLRPEITTVEAFAEALDLSPRHLLRLCRRLFGFPPKLLLRRQRFLRTLEAAFAERDRPFADVLDGAYFDQSHFVRDFHHFMGFSPTRYFQLDRPLLGAAQQARLKALGASFQGLHAERMRMAKPESGLSKPLVGLKA